MNPFQICKVFGDRYLLLIMAATYIKPRSAREVSKLLKISIPVAYRKIDILEKMGLIKCSKSVLTRSGRRLKLYEPTTDKIELVLDGSKLKSITRNSDPHQKTNTISLDKELVEN